MSVSVSLDRDAGFVTWSLASLDADGGERVTVLDRIPAVRATGETCPGARQPASGAGA